MLTLHRPQRGIRFSRVVFPPLLSGMLCPHWKSKALIVFVHQTTGHLPSNVFFMVFNQTCSRSALGMVAFRLGFALGLGKRCATLACCML